MNWWMAGAWGSNWVWKQKMGIETLRMYCSVCVCVYARTFCGICECIIICLSVGDSLCIGYRVWHPAVCRHATHIHNTHTQTHTRTRTSVLTTCPLTCNGMSQSTVTGSRLLIFTLVTSTFSILPLMETWLLFSLMLPARLESGKWMWQPVSSDTDCK